MKRIPDLGPKLAFLLSLTVGAFAYGYFAHSRGWFPASLITQAELGLQEARENVDEKRAWYYYDTKRTERSRSLEPARIMPGLTLVSYVAADKRQAIEIIDAQGATVHKWDTNWFDLWPDATHLADEIAPKAPPGAVLNGVLLMDNGDVIFNFDACGLVRLDACGEVVWRVPLRTHHSLCLDGEGDIWTSVRYTRKEPIPGLTNHVPWFEDYTIVELSPEGRTLREVSLFTLLRENDLEGLLYLSARDDNNTEVTGDTLHVNDVEIFPATMTPGFFQPGDVMVSLRNINTIAVFGADLHTLRYVATGRVVRQHDPDFVDGNTFSIYDNHNRGRVEDGVQSRIVVVNAPTGDMRVAFAGKPELPFFSTIIGRHQWLENGNLLVVETTAGRVFEVGTDGKLIWEFINLVGPETVGLVSEGMRLPARFTPEFFARQREACARDHSTKNTAPQTTGSPST